MPVHEGIIGLADHSEAECASSVGRPVVIDAVDARGPRAALQVSEQRFECRSIALRPELDGAVREVADPAVEAESFGPTKDEETKADALDAAEDYGVEGVCLPVGHRTVA